MKKQMFKKLTAVLLVLIMIPIFSLFTAAEDNIVSGIWGENLTWTLNKSSGLLTISGEGEMESLAYKSTEAWKSYQDFITAVIIEDGITSIGSYSFSDCTLLASITIPDSVTAVDGSAFKGCTDVIQKENGVSYVDKWIIACDRLVTEVSLRENTCGIASNAFYRCTSLTSVTIPDSVTSIGNLAFYGCTSLTSITISNSVTSIGHSAFSGCYSLTSVMLGNRVTCIGSNAFWGCTLLTNITIPDSVTRIGEKAFFRCSSLTNITIPDNVTSIGAEAFSTCISLISVTLGNGIKSLGRDVFNGCTSVIYEENGVSYVDKWVVNCDCSVTELSLRADTRGIGESAFFDCSLLTNITIPGGVMSIDVGAFWGCTSLNKIIFCGTEAEWIAIEKAEGWDFSTGIYTVVFCPSHIWDEGVITTPATLTSEGVKTYTCTTCGMAKLEETPKLSMSDSSESNDTTPMTPATDTSDRSGCASFLASPWSVLAFVAILPLSFLRKKKENE